MKTINKNIIANLVGRGWNMISIFLFTPFYINILGYKLYGLISFYAVLQGLLIFADAGLTATIKRELAKPNNRKSDSNYKYKIFRSIEALYLIIVCLIICTIFFGADFLVRNWLNIEDLDPNLVIVGLRIMSFSLAFNFFSTFYSGGLIGLEKQVLSNILQIIWGILKNGVVILIIFFIDKSLSTFFYWQLGVNILYVIILRFFIVKQINPNREFHFSFKNLIVLKDVRKFASGMLLIALISALNSQFDKIVLSKVLTVSDLATYTVAYSLSMLPIIVAGPIATAIFPRFVKYFDLKNYDVLIHFFNKSFKIVLLIVCNLGIMLSLYSEFFFEYMVA